MSLLIKALEKAAQEKKGDSIAELSLEPIPDEVSLANQKKMTQKEASTVFLAKQEPSNDSKRVFLFSLLGFIFISLILVGFYLYLQSINPPETQFRVPLPKREIRSMDAPNASLSAHDQALPIESLANKKSQDKEFDQPRPDKLISHEAIINSQPRVNNPLHDETVLETKNSKPVNSKQLEFGDKPQLGAQDQVKITSSQPEVGVNPNLLAAYGAFNSGDDLNAQKNYRLVLRSDIRNTDALLGMAAIAARQGRNEDALGWYGKVLEVDPKNEIAQAAMITLSSESDPVTTESHLKSMLAEQPNSAFLYEKLGNLYAQQNQWLTAQAAYFQAFHYASSNPEYAFNLAVSLEQIGKPDLALTYYLQAKSLMPVSGVNGIDRNQLEERISILQRK